MTLDTDAATAAEPSPEPEATAVRPRSRLDRALTITGEILITAGVLLGLYVVWQLFYTDVQSERIQEQAVEELDWVEPVTATGNDSTDGTEISVVPVIPDELKHTSPDGAPVISGADKAEIFATLYVPRWGTDYIKPIAEGVTRRDVLDKIGIGHYPNTVFPGGVGNFSVAGHRTTYGKPFADADKLQVDDYLVVQTEDAWFVYSVVETKIVTPSTVSVIAPNPLNPGSSATQAMITLTTCHPKFSAAQRMVVHGTLVYWAPTGHGYPPEILEEP